MKFRRPFPDLPGDWTVKIGAPADYFVRNLEVVLLEQDLGRFGRLAGWLTLTPEAFAELEADADRLLEVVEHGLDRIFRPWCYRDDPGFLDDFDPTPRLSRALKLARRARILATSSTRRLDLVDDVAYLAARRLRRAADRLDERFEERRTSWRRP